MLLPAVGWSRISTWPRASRSRAAPLPCRTLTMPADP